MKGLDNIVKNIDNKNSYNRLIYRVKKYNIGYYEGCKILFLDGNSNNLDKDNIVCLDRNNYSKWAKHDIETRRKHLSKFVPPILKKHKDSYFTDSIIKYCNLIKEVQTRGTNPKDHIGLLYKHEIIPLTCGGKDIEENIILLTHKEKCYVYSFLDKIFEHSWISQEYGKCLRDKDKFGKYVNLNTKIEHNENKVKYFLSHYKVKKLFVLHSVDPF